MKRPLLAVFGLAGACAACCAIPLALPVLAGLSATGLTAFDWQGLLGTDNRVVAIGVGVATTALATAAFWLVRRRRTSTCASPASPALPKAEAACGCGCGPRGGVSQ